MKNWRTHKKHQCLYTSFPVQFMWTVLWKYHSYSSKSFVIFFSSEMLQGPQSGSYYSEWCCTWNTLEVPIVYLEIVNMQSHYNYYCVFSIVLSTACIWFFIFNWKAGVGGRGHYSVKNTNRKEISNFLIF